MPEANTSAAPVEGSAESAPAPQPGAENPDGLKEQPGASPEESSEPPKEGEAKTGTPKGVQKRLDELTRQRGEAQRMNDRLMNLAETLAKNGGKLPEVAMPSGPPRREQFEKWEDWQDAKADYRHSESLKALHATVGQAKQQEAAQAIDADFQRKLSSESAKAPELGEYVDKVGFSIAQVTGHEIKASPLGIEIVKFLGENQDQLDRISQLSPAAQVREIGKIEARLELKQAAPAKQASKAPPPIEPVGGKGGNGSLESMSMAEYEAMRSKDPNYRGVRRK